MLRRRPVFVALVAGVLASAVACESLVTDPVPYGTVRVRAVTRDGRPLPGIAVELYTGFAPHGYHTTDDSGRTVFSRVPQQQYGVLVKPGTQYGLLQEILPETSRVNVDGINVTAATDTTFTFVLTQRGPGAIEARVQDQDSLPVVGVRVGLYNFAGELTGAFTNAAGVARFDPVPYGNWGVYVDPPDSLGVPGSPRVHRDGIGIEGGIVVTPRLTVNRCLGRLTVTVLDQDSLPVPNYRVQLYTYLGAYAYRDASLQGLAVFDRLACGNYGVLAEPTPGFSVDFTIGRGIQDGLIVTNGAFVNSRLFVTRNPPE